MAFIDTLRKNLTKELYTQVIDALGDDFDFDLVPRSRLNEVIAQRNELRTQLGAKSQKPNSQPSGDENDGDPKSSDTGAPNKNEDVEELKKQWQQEQEKAVREVRIQYAALDKLRAAGIIDPDIVWSSNVLDKTKLGLDDNGSLTGLDDMLTQLKKDKPHLFQTEKPGSGAPAGTGKTGGSDEPTVTTKADFLKLDVDKQLAFKAANPEMFKQFMNQ